MYHTLRNWAQTFSLTLPLLFSGLSLIIVLKINAFKLFDIPLDLGSTIGNKRVIGNNKTFRGVLVHAVMATLVTTYLYQVSLSKYSGFVHPVFKKNPILTGLLYSGFYSLGEIVNSAIKRRLNIAPGEITKSRLAIIQTFFDLSDGIIVVTIALVTFMSVPILQAITAAIIGIFLHCSTDVLMQKLKLKKKN